MSSRSSTLPSCVSHVVLHFTHTYSFVSELYPPSSALPPFPHTSPTSTPPSTAYIQIEYVYLVHPNMYDSLKIGGQPCLLGVLT